MSKPCPSCSHPIDVELFYGVGRRTKLTPDLQEAICKHIENGATLKVAAASESVFKQRLHEWREKGKAEPDGIYGQFPDSVERARARFETNTLKRLQTLDEAIEAFDHEGNPLRVNKIDPKVAAALTKSLTWVLERTRRERYGAQITVKVAEAKQELLESLARVIQKRGLDMSLMRDLLADLKGTPLEPRGDALN